jgi:tRNA (cytidine/uridine-2'-O-)-methyltransferase
MGFNIVLIHPEIPNNTGNIGRLCLATGSVLHLVEPLGFEIQDKALKRSGLDYWPHLTWVRHTSLSDFFTYANGGRKLFFSAHATTHYSLANYQPNDFLIFGKESSGFSTDILKKYTNDAYCIPILDDRVRSLNLANAVAIITYEGLRQLG